MNIVTRITRFDESSVIRLSAKKRIVDSMALTLTLLEKQQI